MILKNAHLSKEYIINNKKIERIELKNLLTNTTFDITNPNEFVIRYFEPKFFLKKTYQIQMSDCEVVGYDGYNIELSFIDKKGNNWAITLINELRGETINTALEMSCENNNYYIDSVEFFAVKIDENNFNWSRPMPTQKAQIPIYWTTLGQPVYYNSFFMGVEFMAADNRILNKTISLKSFVGKKLSDFNGCYKSHNYVLGACVGASYEESKKSFFDYVSTFARPNRFRIQFNSWYDNMLDITPENIEKSFREVQSGFSSHGMRDIDCYVVDDGWVDYRKKEFWAFNSKFPNGFDRECALTKELNSTFGVWFGPRGGYTESATFAKNLANIGYHQSSSLMEVCVTDPKYVNDLCEKMIDFINKYNVTYYKIDGFAISACKSKNHGHPVGGYENLYFYNFEWEEWCKGFEKIRKASPDVFLNVTSHSNCSPWLLKYADAVWLNNSSDIYYEGEGGNLDQCANYRDGRYYDFCITRDLQFPLAYIYNHEPCYAERNYNPPLPAKSHKTVVYTDQEFEKYLYLCMMRGTGFIELYYSPSMFNDAKWEINAKILKWAEDNFKIINKAIYFGGIPKKGEVYGYIAYNDGEGLITVRNPHASAQKYNLESAKYTHRENNFKMKSVFGNLDNVSVSKNVMEFNLEPFEVKIIRVKYND